MRIAKLKTQNVYWELSPTHPLFIVSIIHLIHNNAGHYMKSNTGSLSSRALLQELGRILANASGRHGDTKAVGGYIKTDTSVFRRENIHKTQGLAEWPSKWSKIAPVWKGFKEKSSEGQQGDGQPSELTRQSKAETVGNNRKSNKRKSAGICKLLQNTLEPTQSETESWRQVQIMPHTPPSRVYLY